MIKRIIVITLLLLTLIPTPQIFASDLTIMKEGNSSIRYVSVIEISAKLKRNGSAAKCNIGVVQKVKLDSIKGTLKLVNGSGKVVSTKSGSFKKNGSVFTLSKSFVLPKKGTYKVVYELKTFKGGVQQEKITGYTNVIKM